MFYIPDHHDTKADSSDEGLRCYRTHSVLGTYFFFPGASVIPFTSVIDADTNTHLVVAASTPNKSCMVMFHSTSSK